MTQAAMPRELYTYWRSSAAYRVRIALNLKGLAYQALPVHLINHGGEQHSARYRAINPQALLPSLVDAGRTLQQSLAICEYLDEAYPDRLPLLPREPVARARVRAIALAIACDIHPLSNMRVLQYLEREFNVAAPAREQWTRHWIALGFAAIEDLLARDTSTGIFCHGDGPGLADALLIPQIYNARRWSLDMAAFPTLLRIDAACAKLDAFDRAKPENQPDAVESRA